MAFEMLKDLWDGRSRSSCEAAAKDEARVHLIEHKIGQLAKRIVASDSNDVIMAYETEIEKLGQEKALLRSRAAASQPPPATFAETFRTAMSFLAQPWELWDSTTCRARGQCFAWCFPANYHTPEMRGFELPKRVCLSRS